MDKKKRWTLGILLVILGLLGAGAGIFGGRSREEEKLSLIQKFLAIKEKVHQIDRLLDTWQEKEKETLIHEIRQISDEIIEEL